jgi:glycine cleavage system H protein
MTKIGLTSFCHLKEKGGFMLKFTKTHEWVRIEGEIAIIGITDYAQKELGDIVFVELPQEDQEVIQFSSFATVESTKAVSEVYAPLSGKIIEVNKELINNPGLINQDPQGRGWIVKIEIKDKNEINNLLEEKDYLELIEKEK